MNDDKKAEVVQLFKNITEPDEPYQINGNSNIVGHFNTVINIPRGAGHVGAKGEPDDERITEEQAANLKGLVGEIVTLEKAYSARPRGYQFIWSSLKEICNVSQYGLILSLDYPVAEGYLKSWLQRLKDTNSSTNNTAQWRIATCGFINEAIADLQMQATFKMFLVEMFSAQFLSQLNDDQLMLVYRTIDVWKKG